MSKNIRIIIGSLGRGGAETHLLRVLPSLKKHGWNINVIALKAGGELTQDFLCEGVKVQEPPKIINCLDGRYVRFLKLLVLPLWLAFLFIKDRKSMLHFFLPEAYLLGGVCACMVHYPQPMLMSRRSLNFYQRKYPFSHKLEHYLHGKMNFIIGNSLRVNEQLHQENVPQHKLKLIYNGFDVEKLICSRSMKKSFVTPDQAAFVMVVVANLIPYKGHEDLLKALSRVKGELPRSWMLLCVGKDNGILHKLTELSKKLKLDQHIEWLGSRDDVMNILATSDVGILCSHEEGFSNAILEYMAVKLPVIATDVGGNAEAVIDGKTGYVVPPHDVSELSRAIVQLALNKGDRLRMGEQGWQHLEKNFSLDKCVEKYNALYEELL